MKVQAFADRCRDVLCRYWGALRWLFGVMAFVRAALSGLMYALFTILAAALIAEFVFRPYPPVALGAVAVGFICAIFVFMRAYRSSRDSLRESEQILDSTIRERQASK